MLENKKKKVVLWCSCCICKQHVSSLAFLFCSLVSHRSHLLNFNDYHQLYFCHCFSRELQWGVTHPDRQICVARHSSEPAACLLAGPSPNLHSGPHNFPCTSDHSSALSHPPTSRCWRCSGAADPARSWLAQQQWHSGGWNIALQYSGQPGLRSASGKTPGPGTMTELSEQGSAVTWSDPLLIHGTPLGQGIKNNQTRDRLVLTSLIIM